ncbi:hypothetical protein V501_01081 [Pseudogymnoascus sp. VKM F-4519 (FW-2642)]|nr:hypothetical protein V501_01081 [Pseudogymnoascus sp. VKM F-4519 (FW-2642)]
MWHYGIHIWDVPQDDLEPDYGEYHKVLIAFNLIHTLILPLVRTSIILLLFRVASVIKSIRIALYIILTFNIGACLGPWLALLFLCSPLSGNTSGPTVFNGLSCLDPWQGAIVYVFIVTSNMFTDLLVFPIPCIIAWRLRKTRLRVTAIAAVRLRLNFQPVLHHKPASSDWTYTIIYCLSHAENNAAIIVACIPLLRSLVPRWRLSGDKESETSREPNNKNPRIHRESFIRQGRVLDSRDENILVQDTMVNNSDSTLVEYVRTPEACMTA